MLQKLAQPAHAAPFGPYLLIGSSKWPTAYAT